MTDFVIDNPAEVTFEVSPETRTIRGLALPFGDVANSGGRSWSFSKGSLTWSKVKVLDGHDWSRAVGTAELEETDEGLVMVAKIARGSRGDEVLSLAEDGVYDGLSVGLGDDVKATLRDGVSHAKSGTVREVSLTPMPAFARASVTSVAASAAQKGSPMTDTIAEPGSLTAEVQTGLDFSALTDAMTAGISQGFANLSTPQRETVSAGAATTEVNEPAPYRFDGAPAEHGFLFDMQAAQQGDSTARQRLEQFGQTFAVSTGNVGTLNPTQNRPDLFVPNLQYSTPLWDAVTTGTITDRTPFTVPKFASAGGLVATHVEGVEPTPGNFAATSQTITPTALSGKVEINREVLDQGGSPQVDAIVWGEMLNAWYEARETRVAAVLQAVGTTELNLASATNAGLVDALTAYFAGLQFVRGGNRYTGLVLDGMLFPALVNAADSAGRKLLPVISPSNANGQTSGAFDSIQLGNQTGRAAWALGGTTASRSFSFVPSSVWAWASAPQRFTFEYQVKSVDLAIWGYAAGAVLRDSDVKPIDYTTAD